MPACGSADEAGACIVNPDETNPIDPAQRICYHEAEKAWGEKKMTFYEFGSPEARTVLIQPVGGHELAGMDSELAAIRNRTNMTFRLIAVNVNRWNHDLSPWSAPAVFRDEAFGDGAAETLAQILDLCRDASRSYIIGGYSLAGLFSLWAACQTDRFTGIAAVSPSAWFPGFDAYMREHAFLARTAYLSMGKTEEKVRQPVIAAVGARIREEYALLQSKGVNCTLEWNPGNHFKEPEIRTAKGFAWVMNQHPRSV